MQKRFTNYKASIESFPLGEQNVGVFKPGRFNGFDIMTTPDNINLTFTHSGKIIKTDSNGNGSQVFGVLITPTGTIIHEDGPITLTQPANTKPPQGEEQFRTFILVCEHKYQAVKGGVPATYFLVANPDSGKLPIALPDNKSQVILGVVTKDYYTNVLTYTKSLVPILGDQTPEDIYNVVKPFIDIPAATTLPDFRAIAKEFIKLNQPRTIITPTFDVGDGNGGINTWQQIPYSQWVGELSKHNILNHTVYYRRVRDGDGRDFIDIEIKALDISSGELPWTWGSVNIIHVGFMNNQNIGHPLYAPYELRSDLTLEGTEPFTSIQRFQIQEAGGTVQEVSMRIVIQNWNIIEPPIGIPYQYDIDIPIDYPTITTL